MNLRRNIFSHALSALNANWQMATFFVIGSIGLEMLKFWNFSSSSFMVAYGFLQAYLCLYLCMALLGMDLKTQQNRKVVFKFVLSFLFVILLPAQVLALIFGYWSVSALSGVSANSGEFVLFVLFYTSASTAVLMFLFGTALPARLLEVEVGIGKALGRVRRQFWFLLPRVLLGVFALLLLANAIPLLSVLAGLSVFPFSQDGAVDPIGIVVTAVQYLILLCSLAVFTAVVCKAYVKDLTEQDKLPAAEAEVFA